MTAPSLPSAPPPQNSGGHAWAQEIPKRASLQRDAAVFAAIKAGIWIMPSTVMVEYSKDGHSVVIYAWVDCLSIGLENAVRINIGQSTCQRIADYLGGWMLPTTRMSDAAYQAATKLNPQVLGASNEMDTTAWMVKHSDLVEMAKQKSGASFVRDVGKDWVNSERLMLANGQPAGLKGNPVGGSGGPVPAGANYGWHSPNATLLSPVYSTPRVKVYQSVGLVHDMNYSDYSQVCTLYREECAIDGVPRHIPTVLADPDMAYLLSDEVQRGTACRVWRHPAIPFGG